MSLRSSVAAVLAATVLGAGSASACSTADLAGEWFALTQHGPSGYCTLTVDTTGAVTASACWIEKLKPDPLFVFTGAFAVDDACKVTASLTAAKPGSSFSAAAKLAKVELKGKGGGHGNGSGNGNGSGDKTSTFAGRLLTGAELINGLLVRANGEFTPVSFTRSK